jgi:transcriptional regulator with XRE-family HTH domain
VAVDNRNEIRQFLASRRARITPDQAGLPAYGGNRRVPGLRREEVALLAGVSVDYYTRLERGNLGGVSETVLDGLARALQLDVAERAHLFDLARAANKTARSTRRRPALQRVRPSVQRILEAMNDAPADVRNGRRDILAANDIVANLRTEAGRNPYDRGLSDLVGELSTRSEEFRTRWAAHNVRHHYSGRKHLHHPVVGDLQLTYEVMNLPADPELSLVVYSAEPGSPSQDGLHLLASWAATLDRPDQTATVQAPRKHDRRSPPAARRPRAVRAST